MGKQKKLRNKGYSKAKQREVEAQVRDLIGKNYSDVEIMEELQLQPHVLGYYKKRILKKDREIFESLTPESVLSDLAMKSEELSRKLENLKQLLHEKNQTTAFVQAVRLQADIENKMIRHSHDLGFISRRTNQVQVDGKVFARNSRKDINHRVQVELERSKVSE